MDRWRIIHNRAATGAENMRRDQELLNAITNESTPILRFYSWEPECISLGYFQKAEEQLDLEKVKADGIDVVTRYTGGRAVLHSNELTYSVIAPIDTDYFSTLDSTFMHLSKALCLGMQKIGIPAEMQRGVATHNDNTRGTVPPCFASTSKHELVLNEKKIVGSAQRRLKNAFIQHGSIMLGDRFKDLDKYILQTGNTRRGSLEDVEPHGTSIITEMGQSIDSTVLEKALISAFSDYFSIEFDVLEDI